MLKGPVKLTEEIADKLFESGCSDGTPGMCNGIFSIDFHREADSLEEAIGSAVANLKAGGGLSSTAWRSRHRQFPSAERHGVWSVAENADADFHRITSANSGIRRTGDQALSGQFALRAGESTVSSWASNNVRR